MGGFLQALSALAPVAPALSDAQDIRAQRQADAQKLVQQAAQFPKEQALRDAQITAANLAAQQEKQPVIIGEPQWDPTTHTNRVLTFDRATGALALKDAPGVDPAASAEARYQAARTDYKKTTGKDLTPEEDQDLFFQSYGYKAPPTKLTPLTGAAGQPQEYPKGSGQYVRFEQDATGATVAVPMPAGYTAPEPKPGTPRPGMAGGKNVFGFFNPGKHQWQDAAGNALPDFQPQPSFAETGLYEPMASYNPTTQSIAMGAFNRRTGGLSFSNAGGASVPLPPAIAATIGKEFGTAREAQTRLRVMQQNATQAYQGNQQAMVSLLMNHIGMTLGAQKGTRVAKSVIDEARQSAPWVDTKLATVGHTDANGDFIFDGAKGGINLTGEQIGQMVDLAKQRNDLQWQQVKDTGETYGVDLSGAISQTQGAAPGAGGHSGGTTYKQTATGPNNHKIGSNDGGVTWYDVATGRKI